MKYLFTNCAFDHQFAGNFLWHSSILLSKWDDETHQAGSREKIEVIGAWGFYGVPPTTQDAFLSRVKVGIGLNIDLSGNHGLLCHEEMRYMERGFGLHGFTYELTQNQFELLHQKCIDMIIGQQEAIHEIASEFHLLPKSLNASRRYPFEYYSKFIFDEENARAQEQERPPRLKPFDLNLSNSIWGPTINRSHNCKTQMIDLLEGILSPDQINKITANGRYLAVPRFSGDMENIVLHSRGPLREHKKSSGKTVHYRDIEDEHVRLFWSFPPQKIEALDARLANAFRIGYSHKTIVKKVVGKLQKLEWFFIDASLPEGHHEEQQQLIQRIQTCYEAFSYPEFKQYEVSTKRQMSFFSTFENQNQHVALLLENVSKANVLLDDIYVAITEDGSKKTVYDFLSLNDKTQLSSILGRPYRETISEGLYKTKEDSGMQLSI